MQKYLYKKYSRLYLRIRNKDDYSHITKMHSYHMNSDHHVDL